MARISGLKVKTDSKGNPTVLEIDLRKITIPEEFMDYLDGLAVDAVADEETVSWESLKAKLRKKHGRGFK